MTTGDVWQLNKEQALVETMVQLLLEPSENHVRGRLAKGSVAAQLGFETQSLRITHVFSRALIFFDNFPQRIRGA